MLNQVKFSCTALRNGKKGVLPKDDQGYYEFPVGALNVFNSVGEYYTYEGAKQLFEGSSALMRRVRAGVLKGEAGHPKPLPGQSMESYANRVMTIEEQNVAAHFSEVWLDFDKVKDDMGRPVIAIMAKVIPAGPFGPALEQSMQNPNDNTCFSIRAFTEDAWVGGTKNRTLKEIVSWDWVGESGLAIARKYNAPSLESFQEHSFTRQQLLPSVQAGDHSIATESSRGFGLELFQSLGWKLGESDIPAWSKW